MNTAGRLAAFRRRLAGEEGEAALVTLPVNMRYLTGFEGVFDEGIAAAVLVTADVARFYTDFRYAEAAKVAAAGTPWAVHIQADSLYVEICRELRAEGISTLTIEDSVPFGRFKFISEQFIGRVVVAEHQIEDLRQVKETAEIEAIQRAAALTDRAFDHILGFIRAGMREVDIAVELEGYMRMNGSEGLAFDSIVASGPNSARPHAGVTDRVINDGEFLKLDFGARVDGYCSDMTRTVMVGEATAEHRRIYDAVLLANEAAIAGARAGMAGSDIDAIARDLLTAKGFGENFGHGLGHGVGLAVHELPSLGRASRGPVRSGSVVTIEPGVYLPGFGGVRIEDLVVVEDGGVRLLSHSPKELIQV
ncbi:MAG: aminopeptidase P family protein [Coriobacteriia bacterium]|nr:aminopeptidase P family protein [Coriobacteriia bacterium]